MRIGDSMKGAVPPTVSQRVRRLRSPGVAGPRRLVPVLPPPVAQRSRTPDGLPPGTSRSPRRLVDNATDLTVIREPDVEDTEADNQATRPADTVRVVVRCRPMNTTERARGDPSLVRFPPKESTTLQVVSSGNAGGSSSSGPARELVRSFQFDLCASEVLSQGQFFRVCGVIPLLESVAEGYLATVFAYGQTGSGKTFSMSGLDELLAGTDSRGERVGASNNAVELSEGLIPRALKHLFALLAQAPIDVKTVVRASYCEIYNEQVFDLLNPGSGSLNVRWNARAGFYVQDLLVVRCDSLSDVLAVVDEGHRNRHVGSHSMNADSSRSHSLLTIHVDRTETQVLDSGRSSGVTRYGKMSFVDLAGSERLKETRSSNAEETSNINRSLLTLGKVISALAASSAANNSITTSATHFVPYRDSKLTKLLMDSLGGQSLTLMIACVSPSAAALEDTLSTLNYAARAKNIRNKPTVQVDPIELELSNLRQENHVLRTENDALRLRLQLAGPTSSQTSNQPQRQPSLASIPSSSRLFPIQNSSPTYRATRQPSLTSLSPSRLPTSQLTQLQGLQDDNEKLVHRVVKSEQKLKHLEAENKALRQGQNRHLSQEQTSGNSGPSNEMRHLQEQVKQLQEREQELMQALSRRSRGRRE